MTRPPTVSDPTSWDPAWLRELVRDRRRRFAWELPLTEDSTRCPTPVYLAWIEDTGAGVTASPCKRWACEHCGKGRRAEALKLIRHVADTGLAWDPRQPLRFVTLTRPMTTPADIHNPDDWQRASVDLAEMVKAARRWWSRPDAAHKLEYVRVTESTRRGRIHLHLITWGHWVPKCTDRGRRRAGLPTGPGSGSPCYCPETRPCIQRLAHRHGWGWVEIRRIRSPKQAASYLAKYLGKQTAHDWPRHVRRLSYSRHASGGATLGNIHAAWVADVRRRLADPARPVRETRDWIGVVPRPLPRPRPPPLALPPAWGSAVTGEVTPDPF